MMTANQINYAKYLEDVRSHKASEAINTRQAEAAEQQAYVATVNAETNRMNAETNKANSLIQESAVGAQWYGAQANRAYQEAMANVSAQQAAEAQRHNVANEQLSLLGTQADVLTKKYQTDVSARTSERNTDVQARTSERNVDKQSSTSERNTDVSTRGSMVTGLGSSLFNGIFKLLQGG